MSSKRDGPRLHDLRTSRRRVFPAPEALTQAEVDAMAAGRRKAAGGSDPARQASFEPSMSETEKHGSCVSWERDLWARTAQAGGAIRNTVRPIGLEEL